MKDDKTRKTGIVTPQEVVIREMITIKPMPDLISANTEKKALSIKPIQNIAKPPTNKTGKK